MPPRHGTKNVLLAAAVLLTLGGLAITGVLAPVTDPVVGALLRVAAPVYGAGAGVRGAIDAAFAGPDADAASLRAALDGLTIENAKLRELQRENEALKAALAFRERAVDDPLLARVVSETSDAFHGLIIDKGSEDGVMPDQPVVVGDGIIIGKVLNVRRRSSSVLLLADSRSRLAVAIQNGDDTLGVIEGDRGLSMTMTLIPQTENVSPGQVIVTSGIEPGIRRGLIVGTVEKVNKRTQDPFQSASIIPFRSSAHPPFVQVLRPTGE